MARTEQGYAFERGNLSPTDYTTVESFTYSAPFIGLIGFEQGTDHLSGLGFVRY
jgi:hypothetical protein